MATRPFGGTLAAALALPARHAGARRAAAALPRRGLSARVTRRTRCVRADYSNCRTRRSSGILSVGTLPQRRRCVMSSPGSDVLTIELPDAARVGPRGGRRCSWPPPLASRPSWLATRTGRLGVGLAARRPAGVVASLASRRSAMVRTRHAGPAGRLATGSGRRAPGGGGPAAGLPGSRADRRAASAGGGRLARSAWLTPWDLPAGCATTVRLALRAGLARGHPWRRRPMKPDGELSPI